jgi:hypothetical protein
VEIRPRTTGEILDDAWRFALADAPLLLLFAALFLVPAFIAVLLLLGQPAPSGIAQCVLPAVTALLLSLTGLASGACQELFRRRATDQAVSVRVCLWAALRHGLEHVAARAVLMCGIVLGLFVLLMPGLALWTSSTSIHALIAAGKGRSGTLLRELRRDAAFAPTKAAAITLGRFPLLLLAAIQLHLLGAVVLWIADNLGGFDTALLDVELRFLANPIYTTALFLLSWLLLAPFFEAGNYLLHIDIRTRQEGLDLQYRVERAFAGLVRAMLILACLFAANRPVRAGEGPLETVRSVRQGVETIRDEVKKAEPYPGGRRWVDRLHNLGMRLARSGNGDARRFRWFEQSITDFGDRKREDAVRVLDDLHRRLSLLEESLATPLRDPAEGETGDRPRRSVEEVKSLLRGREGRKTDRARPREKIEEERNEPRREEVRRDDPAAEGPRVRGGGGPRVGAPSVGGGGLSVLGWVLLAGLGLAVLAVALYLFLSSRRRTRAPKPTARAGATPAESETRQVLEGSPAELWRQAEGLADEGRFREAVRVLYLSLLSLLHRQQLIRVEPMRTNGEYVRQVHLSERAPPELHEPFVRLTELFEARWYGERPCESADYRACRTLAEEIQTLVG